MSSGAAGGSDPDTAAPRFWRRLLEGIVPHAHRTEVVGALDEGFDRKRRREGPRRARWWYRRQVMGFLLRWRSIRRGRGGAPGIGTGIAALDGLARDARWTIRSLRRRPGFAAVAVVTLALGMGGLTAILALVDAHFLTPLPYDDPDRLVLVWETERNSSEVTTVAPGNYWSWREQVASFDDIAAFNVDFATLSGDADAERVEASRVAPHFFEVLGTPPALGVGFDERVAREAGGRLVILSHSLWTRRYGADPDVIGSQIRIDARPHTVVGVMGPDFRQPEWSVSLQRPELWRPMLLEGERDDYRSRYLRTVARLGGNVSLEEARAEMDAVAERLRNAFPELNGGRTVRIITLDDHVLASARPTLVVLLAAGVALLLIVCANVANLTLARGEERRSELAVRAAMGAGGPRLIRQIVVEGVVLALLGAAVGAIVVVAAKDGLRSVQQRYFSAMVPVAIDGSVILFTAVVAALAGLLVTVPLARSVTRLELRDSLRGVSARGGRLSGVGASQNLLIVAQVGLTTTLLIVAALLSRSLVALVNTSPGFESEGVVTFTVSPPAVGSSAEDAVRYHEQLVTELEALPGLVEIGAVSDLPFTGENVSTDLRLPDPSSAGEDVLHTEYHVATPGYFSVMGIPLIEGEIPTDGEALPGTDGEIPVVVNERLAERLWPEGEAVGRRFTLGWTLATYARVRAVVGNVADDGFGAEPEPTFYVPFEATPRRRMSYVLRTLGDPAALMPGLRSAVAGVDRDVPATEVQLVRTLMAATVRRPRAAALVAALFAAVALLVAAAGIYGVLSYVVQSRVHEIGIRAALGARPGEIVGDVVARSSGLVTLGLAVGVAGALVAGRALSGLLYGVPTWDPASLCGAVALLGASSTVAAWLPARRAVSIDPSEALRQR